MREKRQLTRWRLIYYLRVIDLRSGKLLGHVVDMTVEGMMLVSSEPIEIGRDFDVRVVLPGGSGESNEITCRVRSLWGGEDTNSDFFDTGLRLIDPSEDAILRIQELIENLRFPGPAEPKISFGFGESPSGV